MFIAEYSLSNIEKPPGGNLEGKAPYAVYKLAFSSQVQEEMYNYPFTTVILKVKWHHDLTVMVMGIHFIFRNNYCEFPNSGVSREWIFVSAEKEYYLEPAVIRRAAVPVLLLYNKPPQTQRCKIATTYYAQDDVAKKVRLRPAGTACLCFMVSRSSSSRPTGQSGW